MYETSMCYVDGSGDVYRSDDGAHTCKRLSSMLQIQTAAACTVVPKSGVINYIDNSDVVVVCGAVGEQNDLYADCQLRKSGENWRIASFSLSMTRADFGLAANRIF